MRDSRRTRLILALLLLTAFTLITLDYRAKGGGVFGSMRQTASSWFGPVERMAADVVRPVRNVADAIGSIGSNHKKLQDAEKTISRLQQELRARPFDQHRVDELNALLRVSSVGQYKLVPAQVIAVGAGSGFEWTATIDAGSMDGVKPDMTVLNGDGLVGRVTVVGRSTSTVLLAIDPEFNVGVRLPDGETGVVTGRQKSNMGFYLIDPSARVKPGDGLVTQGSKDQQPFVWGVPVGEVVTATSPLSGQSQTGTVRPYVNFSALDLVGVVVQPPRTDPRQALLESPRPTVTVTATVTATPAPPSSASSSVSSTTSGRKTTTTKSATPTKSSAPPVKPNPPASSSP
ncbi:MAG TPA: rod shape-determining protein MreC [Acidothermaceae bacterium]